MQDSSIPTSRLITAALWAIVAIIMGTAWLLVGLGHRTAANMLGLTGCATSAAAAVSSIRCYTLRICALLRATSGRMIGDSDLHSVR